MTDFNKKNLAVVALGGNALLRKDDRGTIVEQEQNTFDTLCNLKFLLQQDYNLVLTHGNGPQIGNILLRNEAGLSIFDIEPMPLNVCVADSQGGIGYMIERMMRNVLTTFKSDREVVTIVSMVEIDPNDTAFSKPTKRIGKLYTPEEVEMLKLQKGWQFKPSLKEENTYRRVVPSPMPKQTLNRTTIEKLATQGIIVIAIGGGGIPIYFDEDTMVSTTDAVIDKDLASSLLASNINASELYILTDVSFVYREFGKPTQQALEFLDYKDAKQLLKEGMVAEGTMAPKIRACLHFLKNGGKKAVITEATKLEDKNFGTKITMEYDRASDRPEGFNSLDME